MGVVSFPRTTGTGAALTCPGCGDVNTVMHGTFHCPALCSERDRVRRAVNDAASSLPFSQEWADADDDRRLYLSFTPNDLFPARDNARFYRKTALAWSQYRREAERITSERTHGARGEGSASNQQVNGD